MNLASFAAAPPDFHALIAKVRAAMSKFLVGKVAESAHDLVSHIHQKRDELRNAAEPPQITGLQMIFVLSSYYRADDMEEAAFELSALMALEYPGDEQ